MLGRSTLYGVSQEGVPDRDDEVNRSALPVLQLIARLKRLWL